MLANPDNQHDYPLATGRRFASKSPLPFSSRLSRYKRVRMVARNLEQRLHCSMAPGVRTIGDRAVAALAGSAPMADADADRLRFCRTAPSVRFIAFADFETGVLAFE
jgi:hypothetical protein